MNIKEMNEALKRMLEPPPPRFEIDEETATMRCWLCPKEVTFERKADEFPEGWKIITLRAKGVKDIHLPLCADCFPQAEALYKDMKEKGWL